VEEKLKKKRAVLSILLSETVAEIQRLMFSD